MGKPTWVCQGEHSLAFLIGNVGGTSGSSGFFVREDHIGDVSITGELTVTNLVATDVVTTGDNLIILNDDVTGSPTENAGIEVERGTSDNAQVLFNETSDLWQAGIAGSLLNITRHAEAVTDNAVARYDGTTNLLQNSGVIVDDSNNITGVEDLTTSATGDISSPGAGANSLKYGSGATAAGDNSVALGTGTTASATLSLSIGKDSTASQVLSVALGNNATASGITSFALGTSAVASATSAVAMGFTAVASASDTIAIGSSTDATASGAICFGTGAQNAVANSVLFGGTGATSLVSRFIIGRGHTSSTLLSNVTFGTTGGQGTNSAGTNLLIQPGASTGTGLGGAFVVSCTPAGASGSSVNAYAERLRANGTGISFFGATPIAKPSAYTQTYATTAKTHANLTSATLTNSTGGTANTTVQNVGATHSQTILNNNFADLVAQNNALRADLVNVKNVLNALIDDLQALGLIG